MSSGDVDANTSDGDVSAPGEWPTAGAEQFMYSLWPGVRPCSLCSWTPLVLVTFIESVRLLLRPLPLSARIV